MKASDFCRSAVSACAAFSIMAGCSGSQSSPTPAVQPALAARQNAKPAATSTNFTVSGRYIYLGMDGAKGKKFFIKGVDYGPTPIGTYPWDAPLMNDPLRNANADIWQRDLPLIRAMKANAVRVYNVVPPPYDKDTGPISDFLDAAWNNGKQPIYALLTIYFDGKSLENDQATAALATQYYDLGKKYALYPAVMGVTISNEIFHPPSWNDPHWWSNFNKVAASAKAGFVAGGNGNKLIATSNHDSVSDDGKNTLLVIHYGELYHAQIDVWGDNPYRGRTFDTGPAGLFTQIRKETTKPVILTEYGAPASYHPEWANTYSFPKNLDGPGSCSPATPSGPVNRNASELPASGNPAMNGIVDLVTNNSKLISNGYDEDGVVSGGFYFEYTDEWWKADSNNPQYASEHVGDPVFTGHFPGCAYDHAWFGLYSISAGSKKYLDNVTARPTVKALKQGWALQN